MKSFIYTYSEGRAPRNGSGIVKTVCIYRIVRNEPRFVCKESDTFVSQFQLVMQALERAKALPRAAFKRHQFGGYFYGNASHMRECGVASIHNIG